MQADFVHNILCRNTLLITKYIILALDVNFNALHKMPDAIMILIIVGNGHTYIGYKFGCINYVQTDTQLAI